MALIFPDRTDRRRLNNLGPLWRSELEGRIADFDGRLDLAEAKAGSVAQDIVKGELQGQ